MSEPPDRDPPASTAADREAANDESVAAAEAEEIAPGDDESARPETEGSPQLPLIVVDKLVKTFGRHRALNELCFELPAGEIFGLIGPNGAGKTTLIKILATLLAPTRGHASIAGSHVVKEREKVRPMIGYLPDSFGLYEDLLVEEYLAFFAAVYGFRAGHRKRLVDRVMELVELRSRREDPVSALSRGMQQRLGLARVLLHDPALLLLDEPASGLDPHARVELRELLLTLQGMGKTILISSHILSELEEVCTTVGILEQGRFIYVGPPDSMRADLGILPRVRIQVPRHQRETCVESLKRTRGITDIEIEGDAIVATLADHGVDLGAISRRLVEHPLDLIGFQRERLSLETLFLHLTRGRRL